MRPNDTKLDPELVRWLGQPDPSQRTVLIRFARSMGVDEAATVLTDLGTAVQSKGPGTIVALTGQDVLEAISRLSWVVAVESPRPLHMRSPF